MVVLVGTTYPYWRNNTDYNSTFTYEKYDVIFGIGDYGKYIYYNAYPSVSEWPKYSIPVTESLYFLILYS